MKIPSILLILWATAFAFAGPPSGSMRLEIKCPECADAGKGLDLAFRKALPLHGFQVVDSAEKSPSLRVYAYPEGASWFLAPSLSSPRGTVISVSRDEYGSYDAMLAEGADSVAAGARRTVDQAVKRAQEAKPK